MAFIETYRAVVAPSGCDVLNHMNVSGYFQACSDGVFPFRPILDSGSAIFEMVENFLLLSCTRRAISNLR